jgi:hypothetical protein
MTTMTDQIKIDGSGNAYVQTGDGVEFIGSWNPSLRQFTFENGDVWDVEPTTSIEEFLASFPTAEEAAARESLQERDELADLGSFDEVAYANCVRPLRATARFVSPAPATTPGCRTALEVGGANGYRYRNRNGAVRNPVGDCSPTST